MRIAVIGTGVMGSAFAEALIQAGHETIVYNRTATKTVPLVEKGAKAVLSPEEAIRSAEAAVFVLPDAASLREILLSEEMRASLKGSRLLNASTTKPEEILQIAKEVTEYGGDLAEVTIMVGADQLRDRKGQFVLGSSYAVTPYWTELMLSVGERVDRAGEVGDASKAETPILVASMFGVVATAYAAASAIKLGIPEEISQHYISMAIPGAEYLLPNMLARNYDDCMASVSNFAIVSDTALSAARSLRLPTGILEDMQRLFASASLRGFGEKDGSAICEVLLDPEQAL